VKYTPGFVRVSEIAVVWFIRANPACGHAGLNGVKAQAAL
jgi:hypothetical protein